MNDFDFAPSGAAIRRRRALFDAAWDSEQCDHDELFFIHARENHLGHALCSAWWAAAEPQPDALRSLRAQWDWEVRRVVQAVRDAA